MEWIQFMIKHRTYQHEIDKQLMRELVYAFPENNLHSIDLPYRFSSWSFDHPENTRLWFNEKNELVAWAVLQTPFWFIDYAFNPERGDELHQEILTWADEQARKIINDSTGHPCWFVSVFLNQKDNICNLEKAGFASQTNVAEDAWSKVFMQWKEFPKEFQKPDGYIFRPLRDDEVNAYVDLHQSVFQSKNMTLEWRERTLQVHSPETDMVAVAPDGSLAAFCIGWIHVDKGQIEPMGVSEDHRKLGLGQALLSETIKRLQNQGAEKIFVETDNFRDAALQLYESVGFEVIQNVEVYRKDYE